MNIYETGTKVVMENGVHGSVTQARITGKMVDYEILYYNTDKKLWETVILPEHLVSIEDSCVKTKVIGFKKS